MSQASSDSSEQLVALLGGLGKKGVRLWTVNGQLRYRAAEGSLTEKELDSLRSYKKQIVSMLETATSTRRLEPSIISGTHPKHAPLSFSQQAHWNRYKLHSRRALREIACATGILGSLNLDLLRKSFSEMIHRHTALRTRIAVRDVSPMQEITESVDFELHLRDLTGLEPHRQEAEVIRSINELILQPIEVLAGPLWEARLLKIREHEHILIVVMEHIISDARSLQILLSDLFSAYTQASQGLSTSLPSIPVQFIDYAEWQAAMARRTEVQLFYWNTRLSGCPRVRFPRDLRVSQEVHRGWDYARIALAADVKTSLYKWARFMKTTPSMAAFTAYVVLVSRWCETSEFVIKYVVDGRTNEKVQNTIGYFAKQLPLRIEVRRDDNFSSLLVRIMEEYYEAYKGSDLYGLEVQSPQPEFIHNTCFNWISIDNDDNSRTRMGAGSNAIELTSIPFDHPMSEDLDIDAEPFILLVDEGSEISGRVYFQKDYFSTDRMQHLASEFCACLQTLLKAPDGSVHDTNLQ